MESPEHAAFEYIIFSYLGSTPTVLIEIPQPQYNADLRCKGETVNYRDLCAWMAEHVDGVMALLLWQCSRIFCGRSHSETQTSLTN